MRILGLLLAALLICSACQENKGTTSVTTTSTDTQQGGNSLAINAGSDGVVVINNYHGANAEEVEKLKKELHLSGAAIKPLLELLDLENIPLEKRTERFTELATQYKVLQNRLKQYEKGDEFVQQAERYLEGGKLAEAEQALEAANEHDLSLIEERKKDIAKRTFDLASISELQLNYEKAITRYKTITALDPNSLNAWLKLGRLAERIGKSQQALEAYQRLQKYAKNNKNVNKLSLGIVGEADILAINGYKDKALMLYQKDYQVIFQQSEKNANDVFWKRELSVRYTRLGDIYQSNGDNGSAIKAYQNSHDILQMLTELDSKNLDWQRALSFSFNKLGDNYRSNAYSKKAVRAYQDALKIRERLVEYDPNNSEWQRDLSISFNKLGDMYHGEQAIQLYQKALIIREMLSKRDPKNINWQRDLSISFKKLGDMYRFNGYKEKAINAYLEDLKIAEMLAKKDPKRVDWQIDLSFSYEGLMLFYKSVNKQKAQEYGEKGLKIQEDLYKTKLLSESVDKRRSFIRLLESF